MISVLRLGAPQFFWLWYAKTGSQTRGREKVRVMKLAQYRLGMYGVRFSVTVAQIRVSTLDRDERWIGNTWTQRHVRSACIVVAGRLG
jgi:hypothetical protein